MYFVSTVLLISPVCGFLPTFSQSLRNMVSQRAVLSTLAYRVGDELVNDNLLITDVTTYHSRLYFDMFCLTVVLLLFTQRQLISPAKLENIFEYREVRRATNAVLLIVFVIFTKNVDSAL